MKLLAKTELSRPHRYLFCQRSQASLFISKNTAFCSECGNKFSFTKINPFTQKIYCPKCGRCYDYKKNDIIISQTNNRDLPYMTEIKLYEFKNKIELRIYYKSISIEHDRYNILHFNRIKEIYTFDIKQREIIFKKYINNIQYIDKQNIGYLTDLENLTENTALYFLRMNITNYFFDSLVVLLNKLRTAIIKKVYQIHKIKLKNMYINLSLDKKFLGNVLNLAHRLRFFNSPNIFYNKNFDDVKIYIIDDKLKDFEKKYAYRLKDDYLSTVFDLLKLPNIKFLKQHFSFKNIPVINLIYNKLDKDLANNLFEFYLKNEKNFINKEYGESLFSNLNRRINKLHVYIDFINELYLNYYRNVKLNVIFKKYKEIRDILSLYEEANIFTLNKLKQENINFSKLHDWLSLEIAKQPENDFIFKISKNIIDKFSIGIERYQFSCVKKYSRLKEIAYVLKNCSAGYKHLINDRLQLITLSDDEGVKALIEIENNYITQAKLCNNIPVSKNNFINNLIITFSKEIGLKINTSDIVINKNAISLLNKAS